MKQKVVVIGHGYTSRLGVIRALGREGYEVTVVIMTSYKKDKKSLYDDKPIDCFSKYVSNFMFCPPDSSQLVRILLDKCADTDQKVILFADSDFSAAVVDENIEQLRDHFLFPNINNEPGAVVTWMDKWKQKQAAKAVGLDVAEGWVIEVKNGQFTIPDLVKYPCFPKPLFSVIGGKAGLKRCDDEKQLRDVIELLSKRHENICVLVEEFIKIDVEQALMGFSDGKVVIIPGIINTTSLANGNHFGVAKQGKILPVTGYEELVEKFRKFVLNTGYIGIFDIDFYKSEERFFFCEMNFRYGGSGYAYTAMGVNLPVIMARNLVGQDTCGMQTEIKTEALFVNERMCRDDWNNNYISTSYFKRLLKTSDISFIADENDPKPLKVFYQDVNNPVRRIKRLVKRIFRGV